MTVAELAEKLRQMRIAAGKEGRNIDVMTRLFGVIFCDEIGSRSKQIVKKYREMKELEGVSHSDDWPGSPADTVIQDARKLAQFVDPHYDVVRKWRG